MRLIITNTQSELVQMLEGQLREIEVANAERQKRNIRRRIEAMRTNENRFMAVNSLVGLVTYWVQQRGIGTIAEDIPLGMRFFHGDNTFTDIMACGDKIMRRHSWLSYDIEIGEYKGITPRKVHGFCSHAIYECNTPKAKERKKK